MTLGKSCQEHKDGLAFDREDCCDLPPIIECYHLKRLSAAKPINIYYLKI